MVLRMFEELGMPILHIGKCEDCSLNYFWESIPTESYFASCTDEQINATDFESCNADTLYPVDVWLYDHRVRDTINNEDFAVVFPDRAILNGQYVEWPIGGRKLTPRHAIEILNSVGPVVAGADRIHDETVCVAGVDVTSTEHRQSGNGTKGAGAGEYACYNTDYHNTKYFQGCPTEKETGDSNISGACYDMTVHQCSCDPGSCNAELCKAQNGIWSEECPNHCSSECQSNGGGDDTSQENSSSVTKVIDPMESEDESSKEKFEKNDSNDGSVGQDSVVGSLESSASRKLLLSLSTMAFSVAATLVAFLSTLLLLI